ncbi:uncharacterized protein BDR25DRAFT_300110 [Lindgomyces ingoldianus]|uniref:Uncharacterized protein n=1 Tax=Lindgomyces ingoldianus TaxID=673940 RepID=A0ACB6RCP8_9PLEO|nr:uncharacterized protein BDR25DRAFT_300110 [Lindgomyces ingoldianus]KAF2477014.1 hypothetical protein BDR25DRAFT_300110 [Lindgomyces ingoldianus]
MIFFLVAFHLWKGAAFAAACWESWSRTCRRAASGRGRCLPACRPSSGACATVTMLSADVTVGMEQRLSGDF